MRETLATNPYRNSKFYAPHNITMNITKLEAIIFGVVVVLVGIAFFFFSGISGVGVEKNRVPVTIWGTFPSSFFRSAIDEINGDRDQQFVQIQYIQKSAQIYETEFLNALAAGKGPDIALIPQYFIVKHTDKILPIGQQFIAPRAFQQTFIDGAAIFTGPAGTLAVPLIVDPLVLYWNTDLFRNAGIANPPGFWDEFLTDSGALTSTGAEGTFRQSGAALGETNNVPHAKDVLALLILQTGNPLVDPLNRTVIFNRKGTLPFSPAESAFRFFTDFSNPRNAAYSWNSTQLRADEAFIAGKLAMYIAPASEYTALRNRNAHLAMDVSGVPQVRGGALRATYADISGLAITRNAADPAAAWRAIALLTGDGAVANIATASNLPPVRRDVLSRDTTNPIGTVFYRAAVQSRSWPDPDDDATDNLFAQAVAAINSGKQDIASAITELASRLQELLRQNP